LGILIQLVTSSNNIDFNLDILNLPFGIQQIYIPVYNVKSSGQKKLKEYWYFLNKKYVVIFFNEGDVETSQR